MQRMYLSVFILIIFLCMAACGKKNEETLTLEVAETDLKEEEDTKEAESIFVYVCGAVVCEGVYELPYGSRVYEAIERAGGFREDAATANVNQAEIVKDEERIYVPVIGEQIEAVTQSDGRVNINKASKDELMTLPGVGESRAESIIEYREAKGSFQTIEDIMQVSGIKEGLFEKIKDLITV